MSEQLDPVDFPLCVSDACSSIRLHLDVAHKRVENVIHTSSTDLNAPEDFVHPGACVTLEDLINDTKNPHHILHLELRMAQCALSECLETINKLEMFISATFGISPSKEIYLCFDGTLNPIYEDSTTSVTSSMVESPSSSPFRSSPQDIVTTKSVSNKINRIKDFEQKTVPASLFLLLQGELLRLRQEHANILALLPSPALPSLGPLAEQMLAIDQISTCPHPIENLLSIKLQEHAMQKSITCEYDPSSQTLPSPQQFSSPPPSSRQQPVHIPLTPSAPANLAGNESARRAANSQKEVVALTSNHRSGRSPPTSSSPHKVVAWPLSSPTPSQDLVDYDGGPPILATFEPSESASDYTNDADEDAHTFLLATTNIVSPYYPDSATCAASAATVPQFAAKEWEVFDSASCQIVAEDDFVGYDDDQPIENAPSTALHDTQGLAPQSPERYDQLEESPLSRLQVSRTICVSCDNISSLVQLPRPQSAEASSEGDGGEIGHLADHESIFYAPPSFVKTLRTPSSFAGNSVLDSPLCELPQMHHADQRSYLSAPPTARTFVNSSLQSPLFYRSPVSAVAPSSSAHRLSPPSCMTASPPASSPLPTSSSFIPRPLSPLVQPPPSSRLLFHRPLSPPFAAVSPGAASLIFSSINTQVPLYPTTTSTANSLVADSLPLLPSRDLSDQDDHNKHPNFNQHLLEQHSSLTPILRHLPISTRLPPPSSLANPSAPARPLKKSVTRVLNNASNMSDKAQLVSASTSVIKAAPKQAKKKKIGLPPAISTPSPVSSPSAISSFAVEDFVSHVTGESSEKLSKMADVHARLTIDSQKILDRAERLLVKSNSRKSLNNFT